MTGTSGDVLLAAISYRAPDAPARFVESLRQTGFGVLVDHPIPSDLVEATTWRNRAEFPPGAQRSAGVSGAQMGQGTRLSADQGARGFHARPHRGALFP